LKDFYDLWILAKRFDFQGPILCEAIRATFDRRRTPIPDNVPVALSPVFCRDQAKQAQWQAFVSKSKLNTGGIGLEEVLVVLHDFLMAPMRSAAAGNMLEMVWPPSGPWQIAVDDGLE
jgi:hypothetical protein